jgi:hypothetical protein
MQDPKIDRSFYREAPQDELSIIADNIGMLCAHKSYDVVSIQSKAMVVIADEYRVALREAVGNDKFKNAVKREKKKQLIKALNLLATHIELVPDLTESYIVGAGFKPRNAAVKRSGGVLAIPTILRASSTGVRGELLMQIELTDRVGFSQLAFEYSIDQGETWKNGTYSSSFKFTWTQLPSSNEMLIRTRAIGTSKRKSEWSEVVTTAVF